ncbi:MAG UNVERIFIED_CONTAM: hypothetical protein LVR18_51760 [Planctomycetaceae bacterium]
MASRGQRPLRRPLDALREVLMTRHLASAERRLADVRLSGMDRERLTSLLQRAAHLSEQQMRQRMRPVLQQTLQDVRLIPTNIPEQVAADKLVDDALDCIADRGYLTLGYLRDSISRNDLKLPDLSDIRDLWRGDYLLRADDRLEFAMDGVYRRGEFYLRALQTTSSIFFGNRTGRFATLFLIIPFGCAYVAVRGLEHTLHLLTGNRTAAATATETASDTDSTTGVADSSSTTGIADTSDTSDTTNTTDNTDSTGPLANAATSAIAEPEAAQVSPLNSAPTETSSSSVAVTQPEGAQPPQSDQSPFASAAPVLMLGFLLMALIHVGGFRRRFFRVIASLLKGVRRCLIDYPVKLLRQPLVQWFWRQSHCRQSPSRGRGPDGRRRHPRKAHSIRLWQSSTNSCLVACGRSALQPRPQLPARP